MIGLVKFFLPVQGWGFISAKNEQENTIDYLVHFSEINMEGQYKKLKKGQAVSFETLLMEKGPIAINVTPLK